MPAVTFERARARLGTIGVLVALASYGCVAIGAATASADPVCGAATSLTPGETPESDWSDLQTAVSGVTSGTSASFYLSAVVVANTGQNLAVPAGAGVTIDLDGCGLLIDSPAVGEAAIEVPPTASLTLVDSSTTNPGDQAQIDAIGGAADATDGSGAGIGGDGGTGSSINGESAGTITIDCCRIAAGAGGGSASYDAFGAGIGGGGGYPGNSAGAQGGAGGNGGTVTVNGGWVDPVGLSYGRYGAGGAAIGGGGGGASNQSASITGGAGGNGGQFTLNGGSVDAVSERADGNPSQSLGAAVGGGAGAAATVSGSVSTSTGGAGGNGATVIVTGGTLNATASEYPTSAVNSGAGIGGGAGGSGYDAGGYGANGGAGGNAGTVSISGGTVTATGGSGASGSPAGPSGAGVGGGSGGFSNGEYSGNAGAGGNGSTVTISGGSLSAYGGTSQTVGTGTGIGIGGGGTGGYANDTPGFGGSAGSVALASGSSDPIPLAGETDAQFTVDSNATAQVANSTSLVLDGTSTNNGTIDDPGAITDGGTFTNNGTIDLSGTISGSGTLNNAGTIAVSGSDWGIAGHGPTTVTGPTLSGHVYSLNFTADHGTAPSTIWAFATTLAAAGESMPVGTGGDGYSFDSWQSAGSAIDDTSDLPSLATSGAVPVVATYTANAPTITAAISSASPENAADWYRTPVTITFTCTPPAPGGALAAACPAPVTLSQNGTGLSVSQQITATDGLSATGSVAGINIDSGEPSVSVAGALAGHIYKHTPPRTSCRASEGLSGIASCTLKTARTNYRLGYRDTITATAMTNAGVSRRAQVHFTVQTKFPKPKHKKKPTRKKRR